MRISIEEARSDFDKLLQAVRQGERVTIVEDDRPVAEVSPALPEPERKKMTPAEAVDALRRLRKEGGARATLDEIRAWIKEGRRY